MQECTLKVSGCEPIYQAGVCCPVKYMCDDGTVIGGNGLPDSTQVMIENLNVFSELFSISVPVFSYKGFLGFNFCRLYRVTKVVGDTDYVDIITRVAPSI